MLTCNNCGNEMMPASFEITRIVEDDSRYVIEYRMTIDFPPVIENLAMTLEKATNVDVGGKLQRVPKVWTRDDVQALLLKDVEERKAKRVQELAQPLKAAAPGPLDGMEGETIVAVS